MIPTVGRIVLYTLTVADARAERCRDLVLSLLTS